MIITAAQYTARQDAGKSGNIRINFGKYAGHTLKQIFLRDRSYVKWMSENIRNIQIRQAAKNVYHAR